MSPARGDGRRTRDADQEQRRADHRGGEGNVLGVVEHGAVPRAADAQAGRGDQARARTRDQARGRRSGADPADADQRAQDMAQIIRIDRDQMAEGDGNDIEQPAIEKKVLEAEYALVPEAAGIIGDDQLAVMMLNRLIVGDRVVLEGTQRDDNERGDKDERGAIIGAEARDGRCPGRRQGCRPAGRARPSRRCRRQCALPLSSPH